VAGAGTWTLARRAANGKIMTSLARFGVRWAGAGAQKHNAAHGGAASSFMF